MLLQWQEELENRFGLTFQIIDKDYIQRVRRERGFSINPWTTHSRFLISHRLLIDESYTAPLRDWLQAFRPGSLLIFDEAHHAAPSSGRRYAIDSQITKQTRDLAHRFEHRLFLSATPHNGHSNSFSALLEILDPQRFCRGVEPAKSNLKDVMVRRIKDDLREIVGGFPIRTVQQIDISDSPATSPEIQLVQLLENYRALREQRLSSESKKIQSASGLLISGLQQRLFSSVEAFAQTLRVHRKTVERQWAAKPPELPSRLNLSGTVDVDDDQATAPEDDFATETLSQIEAVTLATAGPKTSAFEQERTLLDQLTELANTARSRPDARIRYLRQWIESNLCPNGVWNDNRVIIFTEYDDTRRYLEAQLRGTFDPNHDRIAIFHGPTPPADREIIKRNFTAPPATHPVRILIATDAAREGLNLQSHCHHLFHFDVPWNPSRMEQRNGRIDRKLQPAPEVFCYYFFYLHRPEDAVLKALVVKTARIRKDLGSLSRVIDHRLASLMKTGIRRPTIATLQSEIDSADLEENLRQSVESELEETRDRQLDLRTQIDKLRSILSYSKQSVAFTSEHLRTTLTCALELLGAPPLTTGAEPGRYQLPPLEQSNWAATMDALRAPRPKDQTLWEWRRSSPIRPVVFDDPGVLTDEVVQLHLEHRLVQRLLSRFAAQGFVFHDLSRACLAQSQDAIPRVLLLGRLSLYGHNAARLHEEIVPITARWTDPLVRKSPLSPYAREAQRSTLDLLDAALLHPNRHQINATVSTQLQNAAARDVSELLPHLEERAQQYAEDAKALLLHRADAESKAMREILELQQRHISKQAEKYDSTLQLQLPGWNDDEARQLKDNRTYWGRRLDQIKTELTTEPERVRAAYTVKATRIEPVGLVYLWPVTN